MPNDEDVKLQSEATQATVALLQDPDYQKKQEALGKKLEACSKLSSAALPPCMQRVGEEIEALQAKLNAKAEASQAELAKKLPKGALGCSRWSLGGGGGKVSGLASCPDAPELQVTGTIRAVP